MMKRTCIKCGATLDIAKYPDICPFCNFHRYGENGEYAPTPEMMELTRKVVGIQEEPPKRQRRHRERGGFTDEEILALGLYPDDEKYKMSLISRILGK